MQETQCTSLIWSFKATTSWNRGRNSGWLSLQEALGLMCVQQFSEVLHIPLQKPGEMEFRISSLVRVFIPFFTFSVWIQGRWSNIYASPPVIQPQCPHPVYDLNPGAAGADRYNFWDTLISEDIKRWLIQNCVACIFRNPPSVNRRVLRTIYRKEIISWGLWIFFFFELMKDGQKHMAAVKKDKGTCALV